MFKQHFDATFLIGFEPHNQANVSPALQGQTSAKAHFPRLLSEWNRPSSLSMTFWEERKKAERLLKIISLL